MSQLDNSSKMDLGKRQKRRRMRLTNYRVKCSRSEQSTAVIRTKNDRKRKSSVCHEEHRRSKRMKRWQKQTTPEEVQDEDSNSNVHVHKVIQLAPDVISKLEEHKLGDNFVEFMKVVAEGRLPLDNIVLHLLFDVVTWFSIQHTSQMKYRDETKKFWRVGYKLFHGAFLRFMSGKRNIGQHIENKSALLSPLDSDINFAVPSEQVIRSYRGCDSLRQLPSEIPPGIIQSALELKSKEKATSFILSVDGKKVASGLNETYGDEDLFGFESPKLKERRELLKCNIETIEQLIQLGEKVTRDQMYDVIRLMSKWLESLSHLKVKHSYSLKKFITLGGDNWKESKFVFAISSIKSSLHRLSQTRAEVLQAINGILHAMASQQTIHHDFIPSSEVNVAVLKNCHLIDEHSSSQLNLPLQFWKQRSEKWFNERKKYVLTGSQLFGALGIDSLKGQKEYITKLTTKHDPQIPHDVQVRMDYGTKHEEDCMATVCGKVLPSLGDDMCFHEEGSYIINQSNGQPLIFVSPDGSVRSKADNSKIHMGCEFKAPYGSEHSTEIHYSIPQRYIPQVLAEMAALRCTKLIYASWSPLSTSIFLIKMDSNLWNLILLEAEEVYGSGNPKHRTRISERVKKIKEQMKIFPEKFTTLLMEVPSMLLNNSLPMQAQLLPVPNLSDLLPKCISVTKNSFQITRKKGTEMLVWLLSDTDRAWHPEIPHSMPIAYGLKAYSMPCETMRNIIEYLLDECSKQGIHVACTCFDSQWLKLANRDVDNKPLTVLQLQKDIWTETRSNSKNTLIDMLGETCIDVMDDLWTLSSKYLHWFYNDFVKQTITPESSMIPDEESSFHDECLSYLPSDVQETMPLSGHMTTTEICVPNGPSSTVSGQQDMTDILPEELNVISDKLLECKSKKKWIGKSKEYLKSILASATQINKLTIAEIDIVATSLTRQQNSANVSFKRSWRKRDKVNYLCRVLKNNNSLDLQEKMIKGPPPTLLNRAKDVLRAAVSGLEANKRLRKDTLCILVSKLVFPSSLNKFYSDSHVSNVSMKENAELLPKDWFAIPEFSSKRNKLEPKTVDSHHLHVNLRVKVCKDGLPGYGISKEAWRSVAQQTDAISSSLVTDLIDKQSSAFAHKTFSEKVEKAMLQLGYNREAHFCSLVRNWYRAEDEKGISAVDRVSHRLALRTFLLTPYQLDKFPPYGQYVCSMSQYMFEGFLQSIDMKLIMYGVVKNGVYNVRSVTSLENETFFGTITDMEQTKLGCPKSVSVPRLMSSVTELTYYRHNPSDRTFSMRTARNPVYISHKCDELGTNKSNCEAEWQAPSEIKDIVLRNHAFDQPERCRLPATSSNKEKDVECDIDRPARGCKPIRANYYKCDESKILPHKRLGIIIE